MKNNLYPYKRIKNAVNGATYGIGLSLLVGLIAFFLLIHYFPNQLWIGFITWIGVFALSCAITFLICKMIVNQEATKHKKYIKLSVTQDNLAELFEKNHPVEVNNNSFVYVFQERMFNTISIYHLGEQTTFNDLKPLRNDVTTFLKDNYSIAREIHNHKRHHELNVQLYVTDKFNKNILVHLTDGGEQLCDIGFIRCYWCVDTRSIWIPFYKGEHMDFHAAQNYHNAYKKLLQLFDCVEYCEED